MNGDDKNDKKSLAVVGGMAGWQILKNITLAALPFVIIVFLVVQCTK